MPGVEWTLTQSRGSACISLLHLSLPRKGRRMLPCMSLSVLQQEGKGLCTQLTSRTSWTVIPCLNQASERGIQSRNILDSAKSFEHKERAVLPDTSTSVCLTAALQEWLVLGRQHGKNRQSPKPGMQHPEPCTVCSS